MNSPEPKPFFVAIACGGTGGHLFPGIAVAEELRKRGCRVGLLISPKEIDQQAVKSLGAPASTSPSEGAPAPEPRPALEIFTLPAVGLQNRNYLSFAFSFARSMAAARKLFGRCRPDAVLAMGGFTSAPPILAAKRYGARTFLHESNTIPGRANRYLARFVQEAFVGFPEAAARLKCGKTLVTGTPVRPGFCPAPGGRPSSAIALGLDPERPVVLVVGGSQGASGLNQMISAALPQLAEKNWQWLHLTGPADCDRVRSAYARLNLKAVVKPFLAEMDLALGAATAAVSRAGASSLAELAAVRLPSLLVPFPAAADNHQFFNASAFAQSGAARLLEQKEATPEKTAAILGDLMENATVRAGMQSALAQWHAPRAAERIALRIVEAMTERRKAMEARRGSCGCGCSHGHARAAI